MFFVRGQLSHLHRSPSNSYSADIFVFLPAMGLALLSLSAHPGFIISCWSCCAWTAMPFLPISLLSTVGMELLSLMVHGNSIYVFGMVKAVLIACATRMTNFRTLQVHITIPRTDAHNGPIKNDGYLCYTSAHSSIFSGSAIERDDDNNSIRFDSGCL